MNYKKIRKKAIKKLGKESDCDMPIIVINPNPKIPLPKKLSDIKFTVVELPDTKDSLKRIKGFLGEIE